MELPRDNCVGIINGIGGASRASAGTIREDANPEVIGGSSKYSNEFVEIVMHEKLMHAETFNVIEFESMNMANT